MILVGCECGVLQDFENRVHTHKPFTRHSSIVRPVFVYEGVLRFHAIIPGLPKTIRVIGEATLLGRSDYFL